MVLEGLQAISIADDILVPGCGDTAALQRFEEHHVKLNVNKVKFLVRKATFMGHMITTDGLQPNPATVQALVTMPTTKKANRLSADSLGQSTTSANSVHN